MVGIQFTCNMKSGTEALKSTITNISTPPHRSLFKLGHVFCRYCQSVAGCWWAFTSIYTVWWKCSTFTIYKSDLNTENIVSKKCHSIDCLARWYKHVTGPGEGLTQHSIVRGPCQVVLVAWFIIVFNISNAVSVVIV